MLSRISLILLSLALTASAGVLPLSASIHLTHPGFAAGNISLNADVPDPRFSIDPSFDSSLLPINACLTNVLNFMGVIAYGGFTERHPPKTYRSTGYEQVEIVTETDMTARYLIWGIWLAAQYMIENNRFSTVTWTLRWEKVILGTIKIQATAPHLSLPDSINVQPLDMSPLENGTSTLVAAITDPNIPDESLDMRFGVTINSFLDGKPLTKVQVFMVCYTGLLHCAQKPATATMREIGLKSPIDDVSLNVYPRGPSLAYSYIIRTLANMPAFLFQDPLGFREVNFDMELDGQSRARGAITQGRI